MGHCYISLNTVVMDKETRRNSTMFYHNRSILILARCITSSGIQNTGLTGFIVVSPSNESPARPNNVWNGSTWNMNKHSFNHKAQNLRSNCIYYISRVSNSVWYITESERVTVLTVSNEKVTLHAYYTHW